MYAEWMKHFSLELTKEEIREYFERKKERTKDNDIQSFED